MPLLERDAHCAALLEYAQDARAGQGRCVLVSGEAGVGKSTLLEHVERAQADAAWYWGACDGLFTPRPLAPLLDIADQMGGEIAELCRFGAPREQLFSALREVLGEAKHLTVLAVEDVHWADEASLDLLRFLGRRIRDMPVLLLITYRDDALAADDPLRVAVGELSTQRLTRRLRLPPLSVEAVAEMAAGSTLEPGTLHQLTGGNPFFVTEALQTSEGVLPASVRDAVLARLVGVSGEARRVLEVAALIGSRIQPGFLESVTRASRATIDELAQSGLIIGDGNRLRFRHEIARMAVQISIPPHRVAIAHQDILGALLAEGCDDDAVLAFHAHGAGDHASVLEHASRAGRRASQLAAHREAASQFERALGAAAAAGDARSVATLYDELARELALVDRWQASADASEEALRRWRQLGDARREGDTLRRISRTMWRLCRGEDAERASVSALAALEPLGPSPELAWAYANLANHRMNKGQHVEAIRMARQSREIAEPLGLDDVLSDALNTEACASHALGGVWSGLMHRSLEIAKAARLDEQAGRAYANLYSLYSEANKLAAGESIFVSGLAYCDEHDISTFSSCLRGERTNVLEKLGRWDEAEALGADLLRQSGPSPVNRLNPLISLGKVRARRGDPAAWEVLDEALQLAEALCEPEWTALTRVARAEALWLEGDAERALVELDSVEDAAGQLGAMSRSRILTWRFRITGTPPARVEVDEPFASELNGETARAARLWDDLGLRYDAALALLRSDDEASLRDALGRLEALGASAAARLARQTMRRLGIRAVSAGARATTKAHPAGLTQREHEVLSLVSAGLTNDEIASRLFVSVKTVDHHVSSILAKLSVPSRRAAAAEAARRGLLVAAP